MAAHAITIIPKMCCRVAAVMPPCRLIFLTRLELLAIVGTTLQQKLPLPRRALLHDNSISGHQPTTEHDISVIREPLAFSGQAASRHCSTMSQSPSRYHFSVVGHYQPHYLLKVLLACPDRCYYWPASHRPAAAARAGSLRRWATRAILMARAIARSEGHR